MRLRIAAGLVMLMGVFAPSGAVRAEDKPQPADKGDAKPFDDAEFVKMAASGGMHEIELGKMAAEKATAPEIKKFGAMMVADHTKAGDELKKIAKANNMPLPEKLMEKHQKMVDQFRDLTGTDFDKAYIKHAVMSHEESVALYTKATKEAKSPELQDFATKTLPTVKNHLKMAKDYSDKTK